MPKKKPKRRLKNLRLDMIALVDKPAVPEATFALVKRDTSMTETTPDVETDDVEEVEIDLSKSLAELPGTIAAAVSKAVAEEISKLHVQVTNDLPQETSAEKSEIPEEVEVKSTPLAEAEAEIAKKQKAEEDAAKAEEEMILKAFEKLNGQFDRLEKSTAEETNQLYRQLAKARGRVMDDELQGEGKKEATTEGVTV